MSHFAKVRDGIVTEVIVAEQEFFDTFVDTSYGEWIQTSFNTMGGKHYTMQEDGTRILSEDQSKALRKNFASIGFTYDHARDAFIPPKPFPSWSLNETTCLWEAPVSYPEDGKMYQWNEDSTLWVEIV